MSLNNLNIYLVYKILHKVVKKNTCFSFGQFFWLFKCFNRQNCLGSWIWDVDNKKYLDFTCGIAVTNTGKNLLRDMNWENIL